MIEHSALIIMMGNKYTETNNKQTANARWSSENDFSIDQAVTLNI